LVARNLARKSVNLARLTLFLGRLALLLVRLTLFLDRLTLLLARKTARPGGGRPWDGTGARYGGEAAALLAACGPFHPVVSLLVD